MANNIRERVRELVQLDRKLTVAMIGEVNRGSIRLNLTEDLGMRRICAQMILLNLTDKKRSEREMHQRIC